MRATQNASSRSCAEETSRAGHVSDGEDGNDREEKGAKKKEPKEEEPKEEEPKKPRQRIEDLELFSVIAPTSKSEKREYDRMFREVLTRLSENEKTLRRLSLQQCKLKERRLVDLCRALATNNTLLELDLSSRGLNNHEQLYPLLKALKQVCVCVCVLCVLLLYGSDHLH
jgi:hypothetical protein